MSAASAPGMKAGIASVPAADKSFAQKAAVGGIAGVEMGKMAQQKGSSDQVKQFGARMVDDHSKANDELKQVASAKDIPLPTDLDAKHKAKIDKMQKLAGAQFDRAYMDDMVADDKQDVAEFKKQRAPARTASSSRSPPRPCRRSRITSRGRSRPTPPSRAASPRAAERPPAALTSRRRAVVASAAGAAPLPAV